MTAALREWAEGLLACEAAVELLIEHGVWLRRDDFVAEFVPRWEVSAGEPELASVDWRAAVDALDSARLPCSSGDGAVLRVAASIAEGVPVDLSDVVTCLDAANLGLVAGAVLAAGGARDAVGVVAAAVGR